MRNPVFINSLPKSGTHLLSKCLTIMGYSNIPSRFIAADWVVSQSLTKTVIKRALSNSLLTRNSVNVGLDVSAYVSERTMTQFLAEAAQVKTANFILGHAPYSDLLFNMLTAQQFKSFCVIRDPRDVLVSWTHYLLKQSTHFAHCGHAGKNFEERVKMILDGGYLSNGIYVESFASILRSIIGWMSTPGVMVVRFEDLIGDEGGGEKSTQHQTIRNIVDFLGVLNVDTDYVSSSLFGNSKTFRSGQIAGWCQEFSPDLKAVVNDRIGHLLPILGYGKEYE